LTAAPDFFRGFKPGLNGSAPPAWAPVLCGYRFPPLFGECSAFALGANPYMANRLSTRGSRACRIFVLCVLARPGVSLSHGKTDVIALVNSNEMIGEIEGLLQGKLALSTTA